MLPMMTQIGSQDWMVKHTGNMALKKLNFNDEFTNLGDIYMGFAKFTGEWDMLSATTQSQVIKHTYKTQNGAFIFSTVDWIKEFLRLQNSEYMYNLDVLSPPQMAQFKKNEALLNQMDLMKSKIKHHLRQCSVEVVAKWTNYVFRNGWPIGDLLNAARNAQHLLLLDVNKLIRKSSLSNVSTGGYSTSSSNSYNNGYISSSSNGYSSMSSAYSAPPVHAAPEPVNNNSSNNKNVSMNSGNGLFMGKKVKTMPPQSPSQISNYPIVKIDYFRPGRNIVVVEKRDGTRLMVLPSTCHAKNIDDN